MQQLQLIDLIILAWVEGVADVLPLDPAAHAGLVARLLDYRAGSVLVGIDLGAALAASLYLWRDMARIAQGLWAMRRRRIEPGARLAASALMVAAPWIGIAFWKGPLFVDGGGLALAAVAMLAGTLALLAIDRMSMTVRRSEHIGLRDFAFLCLFQFAGLVPGIGRVAALLGGLRLLGLERASAFRFALLTQIPVLFAGALGTALESGVHGLLPTDGDLLGLLLSFALGLALLGAVGAWIERVGILLLVLYRLALGLILLALVLL